MNEVKKSPTYGHDFDYTSLLGDITRDESTGQIISAKSAAHLWATNINPDAIGKLVVI